MTAPTMEQMLVELMSAHADFITAKKDAWDYALKRRNEALSAALARYAELERERDEARAAAEKEFASVMALSAERDAYRADAERYRWLRQGDNDEEVIRVYEPNGGGPRPFDYRLDGCWLLREEKLDAAIDAAIAQRGGKDA